LAIDIDAQLNINEAALCPLQPCVAFERLPRNRTTATCWFWQSYRESHGWSRTGT
jgi:hypothetical protein